MNTENKKTFWRLFICILFWAIIFCLGFLLATHNAAGPGGGMGGNGSGTHGTGNGSGNASMGQGQGQGQGQGTVAGSERKGDGKSPNARTKGDPETTASAAQKNPDAQSAKTASATPAPSKTENPKAQLKILSTEAASEDVATIYRAGKSSDKGIPAGTSAGFFGVEVTGSSFFLLDVSGSMGSSSAEGKSRLELVKAEMEKMLKAKFKSTQKNRSHDRFRIACFSNSCHCFPDQQFGGYKFSSAKDITAAMEFVNQLFPGGGTNMKFAWNFIIPILKRDKIKAVYFLSDGDPTDCVSTDLLSDLKTSLPDLTVHTISMGQPSALLKAIAGQHGGQYREVF